MNELRRAQPLLGTFVEITVRGDLDQADLLSLTHQAFGAAQTVQSLMSMHEPGSELTRLNSLAGDEPVTVHDWTWQVLKAARQIHVDSNGAFDPAVGAAMIQRGFRPGVPAKNRSDRRAIMADVLLDEPNLVSFKRQLLLDMGGIAKGFAVDQAVAVLASQPGLSGVVNAGGDLKVFGGTGHMVGIRNPGSPGHIMLRLVLNNQSMATSGNYFEQKTHRGRRHLHLVKTGTSTQTLNTTSSVSVVSSSCMIADALTKTGFNLPRPAFKALLSRHDSVALITHADGTYEEVA